MSQQITHNQSAYSDGINAYQIGYDDFMKEIQKNDTEAKGLPCLCYKCIREYQRGVGNAAAEHIDNFFKKAKLESKNE